MEKPNPASPVTRGEFETFRDQVLDTLSAITRKIDEQTRRNQWSLPTIVAVVAVAGTPLVFTIRNLYQGEATARALSDHLNFSEQRSEELGRTDADLRERTRANEVRNVEEETQHRWVADSVNTIHDYEDRMARAYCSVCDREGKNPRLVFPDRGYEPLQGIGQAVKNGSNGK